MAKIMIWDLETAGVNSFKADLSNIVCFGYKWYGSPKTHVLKVHDYFGWWDADAGLNDRGLVIAALGLMKKADVLVAHFGDRFDRRFFQGRCLIHGLEPPPPIKQRDTWRILRTHFAFSSNRLGHAAAILGIEQQKMAKGSRDQWPGWWQGALAGSTKRIDAMAEYCAQDVRTCEGVYDRIKAYDTNHPRVHEERVACGVCGSSRVQYRGVTFVGEYRYHRHQCMNCGKWSRGKRVKG